MPEAILFRILGNDLPPRYSPGQTLANLTFTLEKEPDLPGLEKRWLLNRIACPEREARLRQLIEKAGYRCERLPFRPDEYRLACADLGATPPESHPWSQEFQRLSLLDQIRIRDYIARAKNLYLMNNNAARNVVLQLGFAAGASWVLPWDGGCLLPHWAWDEIRQAMQCGDSHYLCVPMHRLTGREPLPSAEQRRQLAVVEPQLGFSRDAAIWFDPSLRYGSGPKWHVLQRIGVPGPWQEARGWLPWEDVDTSEAPDAGSWLEAGIALRLSGEDQDERFVDEYSLWHFRFTSILGFTRQMDSQLLQEFLSPPRLRVWPQLNQPQLFGAPDQLACAAAAAAAVVEQFDAADAFLEASQDYASVLKRICWLAVDGLLNRVPSSRRRAISLICQSCLAPETALRFTAAPLELVVSLGSLVPLMDVFLVLHQDDAFPEADWRAIRGWCHHIFEWLVRGSQSFLQPDRDLAAVCWYHLEILAIGTFLGLAEPCCQAIDDLSAFVLPSVRVQDVRSSVEDDCSLLTSDSAATAIGYLLRFLTQAGRQYRLCEQPDNPC